MKKQLKAEMEKVFRPEFLNRLDDIIVFRSLTKDDLKQIIDIELAKVSKRLKEKGLTLVLTDEAKEFLIEKGTNTGVRRPAAAPGDRAHLWKTRCPRTCSAARSSAQDTITGPGRGRGRGRQAGHGREEGREARRGRPAGTGHCRGEVTSQVRCKLQRAVPDMGGRPFFV